MSLDFARLFEAISSPHMVVDRNLDYVAVNAAYEAAVLRTREEMLGRNIFELFPNDGESGIRLRASLERVLDTGKPDTLSYIPYDIPVPEERGGGIEQRFWTAVHTPLIGDTGTVEYVVQNTVDVTDIARLRQAAVLPFGATAGETKLLERAREAERQHQLLLAESDEFRRLFQLAPGFFAVLSGPEHVFVFANDAYTRLIGGRSVIGLPVPQALPEIEAQGFLELLDSVYRTGKPFAGETVPIMLQREAGEAPRESFIDFSYDAIRNRDGEITGIFVQGMDRTDAVRTQQGQKLLLDELNHRVKNTLSTVQSIAAQTLRNKAPEHAYLQFAARLKALSNAHNILSDREWTSASLDAIVRQEMGAYEGSRIVASGEQVTLPPKSSIAVALVVHELATNAATYGALSTDDGKLSIDWSLKDKRLVFDWRESGGPRVSPPSRTGFGSRLMKRVVTGELGGDIQFSYEPDGFECKIAIPQEEKVSA